MRMSSRRTGRTSARVLGYERHDNPVVVEPINTLVKGAYSQLLNYFHASLKLEGREMSLGG
jgi:hypothetical protein